MSTSMGIWNATVEIQRNRPHVTLPMATQMAEALDAAGLLVTPLHERAVAACEMYAKGIGNMAHLAAWALPVRDVGRESLASKKPRPYEFAVFHSPATGEWCVVGSLGMPDGRVFRTLNEKQARAVASALNKLEGGE